MVQNIHEAEGRTFGENEELAIISLAFDIPEFFSSVVPYLKPEHFKCLPAKFVFAIVQKLIEKHRTIPTRGIVKDIALRNLTTDDDYEPVLELIGRTSDPREVPSVKKVVIDFAKQRAFSQLYTKDVMEAVGRGDYVKVEEVIEDAKKITDVSRAGIWFFERINDIFADEAEIKYTSGFPKLDRLINDGGPTKGDVFIWMAPTNVGKTFMLCNTGEANVRAGKNVLHISLEGDIRKTQIRYAGAFTNIPVVTRMHREANRIAIESVLHRCSAHYDAELVLYKFPADEIDINVIHQIIDFLRRNKGFNPEVVIVDYLELMVSRNKFYNRDDYTRQKAVATEICNLADKEAVTIFSATQTNRYGLSEEENNSGNKKGHNNADKGARVVDLDKIAESFGKTMPVHYIVSINQTKNEYEVGYNKDRTENVAARARLFIAKNRNGPKGEQVPIRMNHITMKALQEEPAVNITTVGGN
jgi:replicative DNA helicase